MSVESSFKYDVAFSFLARDLTLAKQIADLLPGLATFVYERHKEDLIGTAGIDTFSEAFARDARLTAILFRDGWGRTPWTGVEESAIKGRALATRFTSFVAIGLDDAALPTWIPGQHLYASLSNDSISDVAAIIRARAREQGALQRSH